MDTNELEELLAGVHAGRISVESALARMKHWPAEQLDFAVLDHHRSLRTGRPEVVFSEHKSAEQIAELLERIAAKGVFPLATRVAAEKAEWVRGRVPGLEYHGAARILSGPMDAVPRLGGGKVVVLCAGTSDIPVAEEAAVTCRCLGSDVERLFDVGVAGLHRLLKHQALLASAAALIVVAGMEGALPSVVAGLVDKPVIAVPTSVGYGTGFGGIAALLGMLNSCAPGLVVVNIDNGFGAGCFAATINRCLAGRGSEGHG